MGFRIEFRVDGVPPKKDGANSMWGKDGEVERIIALRKKAFEAMQNQGLSCIRSRVALVLALYVPSYQLERIGDLDNFVGGVCDGLQKANKEDNKLHERFHDLAQEKIHSKYSLLENDSRVMSIVAKKTELETGILSPYYTVIIEEI